LPVHPYFVGCLLGNACLRRYPYPVMLKNSAGFGSLMVVTLLPL
jgi:hypothetical protein